MAAITASRTASPSATCSDRRLDHGSADLGRRALIDGHFVAKTAGGCEGRGGDGRYDLVILLDVKTAISVPDGTFHRVDHAAKRLGVSRSEFFSRAAEKALDALDDDGTTEAINRAIAGVPADQAFTDAAAAALAAGDQH